MSWLVIILAVIFASVLLPVLQKLIGDEVSASLPYVSAWLVRTAANRLPLDTRARYKEEWLAALHELGERRLQAMLWALSVLHKSRRLRRTLIRGGSARLQLRENLEGVARSHRRAYGLGLMACGAEAASMLLAGLLPTPNTTFMFVMGACLLIGFCSVARMSRLERRHDSIRAALRRELTQLVHDAGRHQDDHPLSEKDADALSVSLRDDPRLGVLNWPKAE